MNKCDFWHFRFTANVEQRAVARIKTLPQIGEDASMC